MTAATDARSATPAETEKLASDTPKSDLLSPDNPDVLQAGLLKIRQEKEKIVITLTAFDLTNVDPAEVVDASSAQFVVDRKLRPDRDLAYLDEILGSGRYTKGYMGAEREELGPGGQPDPEPEPQSNNRYYLVAEGLDLEGADPDFFVVKKSGDVFVFMEGATEIGKLSRDRVKKLIQSDRLVAEKPGGRDNVVSVESLGSYNKNGKKPPGRKPRK